MSEEKVITVRHELVKQKEKPKDITDKDPKVKDLEDKLAERESQLVSLIQFNLDQQKDFAVDKYPEHKNQILDVDDEDTLTDLIDQFESDLQPLKIKGKAKLPSQADTKSLTHGANEARLINRLYQKAQYRGRDDEQQKQKLEAKEKNDKMYKSLTSNPKLGARVKDIPNAVSGFNACPKCGAIVEGNFNIKGATCSECGFVSGQGSYVRKVY